MKKINGLEELNRWVLNINSRLQKNSVPMFQLEEVNYVCNLVTDISKAIKDDYPFYASELPRIVKNVFPRLNRSFFNFNHGAFGELFIIVKHLNYEPQDVSSWSLIHPRIVTIAKELYLDGHYAAAANRSFVEVETRLRELFKELNPSDKVPKNIGDVMGALLSTNGAYQFCDTSTENGRDYRRGIYNLFEGSMAAYRNPSSHENQTLSKDVAFEQIVLASQLMKVLDNSWR